MKSLKLGILSTVGLMIALPAISFSTAYASTTGSTTMTTKSSKSAAAADTVSNIITKGTTEINRRLTTLNTLGPEITASTKLSASDKTTLTNTVNSEISGLTTLKSTLAACTTIICAHTAAQSIFSDYRVYALIVPQVGLISTADHQQQVEANLSKIASQISSIISGSSDTTIQSDLTALNSDISTAQGLSSNVESSVIGLQPSDYNTSHKVLAQYEANLKTAATDNKNAISEVQAILQQIKSVATSK